MISNYDMSNTPNFSKMTVVELKEFAKKRNIKIKSGTKKVDIIEIIEQHENLVGNEEEENETNQSNERTDTSMTMKQLKDFAVTRKIKIPSTITRKAVASTYINAYLDELELGFDPSDLGETKIRFDELSPIEVDLEKYAKYKDRAWLKHLHMHGWTVVPKVFSDELVEESKGSFWNWLEACGTILEADENSWSYDSFPSGKFGMIKNYIGQERFLWNLRKAAKPIFEEIYRDPKTKETQDLVCSFDGGIFSIPTDKEEFGSWFHFDQPRSMDSSVLTCVQGVACLTDSCENDGGFCFIIDEGPVEEFYDFYHKYHPTCGIVWGKVDMGDENVNLNPVFKVCAKAGDLILFDSRLMHCNCPPQENYRMATYISFQPRENVEDETATTRMQLFEEGRMTGHWCYGEWFGATPKDYHTYGKTKIEPPELDKPDYEEVADMI